MTFPYRRPRRLPLWRLPTGAGLLFGMIGLAGLAPAAAGSTDADAGAVSPTQKSAIEAIVHDYLLQHPDVMIEALRVANAKLKTDAKDKQASEVKKHWHELVDDPQTPVDGNPHGDVTLVEFFDFQCPYCKADEEVVQKLVHQDGRLRIAYKDIPLLGPASVTAAHAALAARLQHKYDPFRLVLMNMKGELSDATVLVVAKAVGLDVEKLKQDMQLPEIDQQVQENMALAKDLDVTGTPTFVVGKQVVEGAIDLSGMKELVADARKK
jgi:protein-disulfide isomerase